MLIKSEENARLSEMRYRELIVAKGNMVKMTSTVDHLWAVKEIEYGNVVEILGTMKKTR